MNASGRSYERAVVLYPLAALICIILVDKIAILPGLEKYGRKPSTPMENVRMAIRESRREAIAAGKPEVLVLGTSRSEFLKYLHPDDIRRAPFIDASERQRLLAFRFETGTILPAAGMLVQFVFLREYLDVGVLPQLVLLEVSPATFNANSRNNIETFMTGHVYDARLLVEVFPHLRGAARWDVATRLVFSAYNNGFRPEAAVRNMLRSRDYLQEAQLPIRLIAQKTRAVRVPVDHGDVHQEDRSHPEYRARITDYSQYVANQYLRRFQFSESEFRLLQAVLERCVRAGIPVLAWRPRVHPMLAAKNRERGIDISFERVEAELRRRSVPYYSAQSDESFQCLRFTDASHPSPWCVPYLALRLLGAAERAYGQKKLMGCGGPREGGVGQRAAGCP